MKKHLGLFLAIAAISTAALGVAWFGEGNAPHPNDTPTKSLQKINSILYTGGLVVTGTFTASPNVAVTNTPSVNVTNGSFNANVTNGNVGGFTLVQNARFDVDRTAGGITANDILAPEVQIASAVRTSGGTGILKSVSYVNGDNNAPATVLLISRSALTWGTTNAVANLTQTELSSILGRVNFATSDFQQVGTNYVATVDVSLGIKPSATTLYVYAICNGAITNTNTSGAYLTFTILQD